MLVPPPLSAANTTVSSLSSKIHDWRDVLVKWPNLPQNMGLIEIRVAEGKISSVVAKQVRDAVLENEGSPDEVIQKRGLEQISDTGALEKIIDEVIAGNPKQVEQFKSGKTTVMGFLVGQVMKASRGQANPAAVNELLKKRLN